MLNSIYLTGTMTSIKAKRFKSLRRNDCQSVTLLTICYLILHHPMTDITPKALIQSFRRQIQK